MLPLIALVVLLLLTFCSPGMPFGHQPVPVPVKPTAAQYRVYLPAVGAGPLSTATKKGVGLTYSNCEDTYPLGVGWQYNWASDTPSCFQVESVPMVWGRNIPAKLGGNSRWVMGFNEPDKPDQANIPVDEAATLWNIVERRFPERKLAAPAPSDADPEWIVRFRDAYLAQYGVAPRLDALAVHCYQSASACIELVRWYIERAREWDVGEVWLTEFAFRDAGDYGAFVEWLEAEPMVTRYAAFANRVEMGSWYWTGDYDPSLVGEDGTLTETGEIYRQ